MPKINRLLCVNRCIWTLVALCMANTSFGESVEWTLDPTKTSVSLGATLYYGVTPIVELAEQGPGSLTTTATGTLSTELTGGPGGFTSIAMAGSNVVGENNGSWFPGVGGVGGPEPANVGGQVDAGASIGGAVAAVRNFNSNIVSGPISLIDQGGGVYTAAFTDPVFYLLFDLDVAGYGPILSATFPPGRYSFTGTTLNRNEPGTEDARLEIAGDTATLTIPVNVFYFTPLFGGGPTPDQEVSGRFHLVGSLVATAQVPEVGSLTLASLAAACAIAIRSRFASRRRW